MSKKYEVFPYLFEVSWEVCNKVGGIYEVVASKVLQAQEEFGDNYFLIGPLLSSHPEFEETDEPIWNEFRHALLAKNIRCHFGRWNIPGRPRAILVDFKNKYNKNQLFAELWEKYGVDSLLGGFDYQEPVFFSYACGEVIATIHNNYLAKQNIGAIAHFHEWMCGAGLLAVKTIAPDVATVFTTHATMLGRALAGTATDIYKQMHSINPKQEAMIHNITAKCSMELVSAREADVFTTVSQITAEEASAFLHRKADVITTNGLDLRVMPDYSKERSLAEKCRAKLLKPVEKLLRRKAPQDLKIVAISGRYEYHNKGVDVFLEALADMNTKLKGSDTNVLALCLVMGGHHGLNQDAVCGDPNVKPDQYSDASFITPFHVYDQPHDSILNACKTFGLDNNPSNNVQVLFVPAMLDGHDGFFDMEYFEILAGCDLSVFPSWYEPWGYTPHEAAAYGVPTITTDLSGFGLWVRDLKASTETAKAGVDVIGRHNLAYEGTVKALEESMLFYIHKSQEELLPLRKAARMVAEESTWEHFYPHYCEAYERATERASERSANADINKKKEQIARVLTGSSSTTPLLRMVTAVAELPPALSRLRELATNLWWAWQHDAKQLFIDINPEKWNALGHNPVLVIEQADPDRLLELSKDTNYLEMYQSVLKRFDEYMAVPIKTFDSIDKRHPIAYFCCEFGLHESLPIYSGGLGILAGDHMKSVSDLALPLVGIGLLYRNGYFRQKINSNGQQEAIYPYNDFSTLPVEPVCDSGGSQIIIELEMPGRILYIAVWRVNVGRTKIFLLDTDIPKNTDDDRQITARLYEADRDIRLRQEIVLGMGGVHLCYRLGLEPSVFHMNEGHSAFLIFERIRKHQVEDHMSLKEAMEFVAGSCVFTTHTPVDAGNERFTIEQMARYFTTWSQSVGMSWNAFLQLGRIEGHDNRNFDMTVLALRFSHKSNGVSWLHGVVSRRMWRDIWKGLALEEVPIDYVTNGIHTTSFVGDPFRNMLKEYVSPSWDELPTADRAWDKVHSIPDHVFWNAKNMQKQHLLEKVKQYIPEFMEKFGISRTKLRDINKNLNSKTLVIGFARRFAPYKRASLLFADPDRLAKILNQADRPVVFLFSGKSHPADGQGIELIKEVIKYSCDERFMGKIFFLEDYSLTVSKLLVQGCDVWLNNPRRPHEASGTSGQKVPVNGGINLSVSDGWWCEGYNGTNGWTIGPVVNEAHLAFDDQDNYEDAESLYTLLEEALIPTYYDRNDSELPKNWIKIAKNSLRTLAPEYSTHRMLGDYLEKAYIPTANRNVELSKEKFALARENAQWRADISSRFESVKINNIELSGINGDTLVCGQEFNVEVNISHGNINLENLDVQLVIGAANGEDFTSIPETIHLKSTQKEEETALFAGTYVAKKNGRYAFGIRVLPVKEGLNAVQDSPAILWG